MQEVFLQAAQNGAWPWFVGVIFILWADLETAGRRIAVVCHRCSAPSVSPSASVINDLAGNKAVNWRW